MHSHFSKLRPSAPFLVFAALAANAAAFQSGSIERVSVDSSGTEQTIDGATESDVSNDGRFVVFQSTYTALVGGDSNGVSDIFLRDRSNGTTTRVSVSSAGAQANGPSTVPSISKDGRFIAFQSSATNLVAGDTNGFDDIFVRDTQTNTTSRINLPAAGMPGNPTQANGHSAGARISPNGARVVYESSANNLTPGLVVFGPGQVFRSDVSGANTILVSVNTGATVVGNGTSNFPHPSDDARFVEFQSAATNLAGADANGSQLDVFVRDVFVGSTVRCSVTSGGAQVASTVLGYSISGNGRFVIMQTLDAGLVVGDTNASHDTFRHDTTTLQTVRCSVDAAGVEGNFHSYGGPVSPDGRFVTFMSGASNLAPPDTNNRDDILVKDMQTGAVRCASRLANHGQSDSSSANPSASEDARFVGYHSDATNLVPGDTNNRTDVFLNDQFGGAVYCTPKVNSLGCTPSIASFGTPSATSGSGYVVSAVNAINNKAGLLLYCFNGAANFPFEGGTMCVGAPRHRSVGVDTGGNPGPNDCSGVFSLDMNAFAVGTLGGNPQPSLLIPGTVVHCQFWGRDPGFAPPNNVQLTDALSYVIGP